jgi:site-specific DNA recombinase
MTNPLLAGRIVYKGETYQGEHEPVVEPELFDRVQKLMRYNGRTGGLEVRNKYGALLRGLLRCKQCDASMTHTFTGGRGKPFYRYYRCCKAIKTSACPGSSLPAAEIERLTHIRQRLPEVEKELAVLESEAITREDAKAALAEFDEVWSNLIPREQARLLNLVFERVEFDAAGSSVSVTFRPTGIAALCKRRVEEAA